MADSLQGIAQAVKIVELPGLPHNGDVSDWLAKGGTREELLRLVETPEEWTEAVSDREESIVPAATMISQEFTDNALATEFIKQYGDNLKFVVEWKSWLAWEDGRWINDLADNKVLRLAREFAESLWKVYLKLAKDTTVNRDELSKFRTKIILANKSQTIRAIIALATADENVAISCSMLNQQHLRFNCPNGTIDLPTGELLLHNRDDLITHMASVGYHPDAKCPKWRETIDLICNGDTDLADYLQSLLGY